MIYQVRELWTDTTYEFDAMTASAAARAYAIARDSGTLAPYCMGFGDYDIANGLKTVVVVTGPDGKQQRFALSGCVKPAYRAEAL